MAKYDPSLYATPEWFESLKWQHHWIEKMVGWWVGHFGKPQSVCDFGGGDGWWCKAFHDFGGCHVVNVELSETAVQFNPQQVGVIIHDLRYPLDIKETFDHCICLEVAEHLPNFYENILCDTLVKHVGHTLLFSSARPGQQGTGHINLRSQEYWRRLLEAKGLKYDSGGTKATKQAFGNIVNRFMDYLPDNLQVFVKP